MTETHIGPPLPTESGRGFITDGGLETVMIFDKGRELPAFAALALLKSEDGRRVFADYLEAYLALARASSLGLVLDTPTWRASPDWIGKNGFESEAELKAAVLESIAFLKAIRARNETPDSPIVISGCIGPRGDGYKPGRQMSVGEARDYHAWLIGVLKVGGTDFLTAMTMNTIEEASGVVLAARDAGLACVISFTVETDGRLPGGPSLREAIAAVDRDTDGHARYFMINCAHPEHIARGLEGDAAQYRRIKGLRVNASRLSHAELDCCEALDNGDPRALGDEVVGLLRLLPQVNVLGGCCGSDYRHIAEIVRARSAAVA